MQDTQKPLARLRIGSHLVEVFAGRNLGAAGILLAASTMMGYILARVLILS